MRYREGYWREDIEAFKKEQELKADFEADAKERGWRKRHQKKIDAMTLHYRQKQEGLNKSIYEYIENIISRLGTEAKIGFDNYATGCAKMIEEYVKAKNTVEILTVCTLYNQGLMDDVFEATRKHKGEDG